MLHISETIHHMIISPRFFSFFQNFDFLGCELGKWAKTGPNDKTFLSAALHISRTIPHMIVICG